MSEPMNNPLTNEPYPHVIYRDSEGRVHREEGPAFIERDRKTDRVWREEYYRHGQRHREEGPAIIWYGAEG